MSILTPPPPLDAIAKRSILPIDNVLALPSIDHGGLTTVESALKRRDITSAYYRAIAAEMAAERINRIPVLVMPARFVWWRPMATALEDSDTPVFAAGHHRVKIALEAGLTRMLITNLYADATGFLEEKRKGQE